MPDIHHFTLFVISGLLLNLTPGADMLFIASRSAQQGVRAGAAAALGVGVGCLIHVGAVVAGLSALLAASATAFAIVKWLGAAYLLWLGIGLLRSRAGEPVVVEASAPQRLGAVFMQGLLTNLLNPKVVLFFLAFLPQFVDPNDTHRALALLALGLVFSVNGTLVNLLLAWGAAHAGRRAARLQRLALWLRRVVGGLFVVLGLRLAWATR